MIDILVVGGGTAGLTAGLYGVRAGKTVKSTGTEKLWWTDH